MVVKLSDIGKWECKCSCGKIVVIRGVHLRSGHTKSCGCLHREKMSQQFTKHGLSRKCREMGRVSEYGVWKNMRQRCRNPNNKEFSAYGGRGILVDPAWDDFSVFFLDMGPAPFSDSTIDRIDANGNYCKENCRWVSKSENSKWQRKTQIIVIDGIRMTGVDAAKFFNVGVANFARVAKRKGSYQGAADYYASRKALGIPKGMRASTWEKMR